MAARDGRVIEMHLARRVAADDRLLQLGHLLLSARLEELRRLSPEFAENEKELRLCASRAARSQGGERAEAERAREALLQKRTGLLRAYGKPDDWLENKPDCPLCGDRGYIGTQKCECLLRALAQAQS